MLPVWRILLRGGAFDGWEGETDQDPPEVLIVWACQGRCEGHVTSDPSEPLIVLATAEAYRRVHVDTELRLVVYEVGEGPVGPEVSEFERVLVGAGLDGPPNSDPYDPRAW